jgi:hypothetical protein
MPGVAENFQNRPNSSNRRLLNAAPPQPKDSTADCADKCRWNSGRGISAPIGVICGPIFHGWLTREIFAAVDDFGLLQDTLFPRLRSEKEIRPAANLKLVHLPLDRRYQYVEKLKGRQTLQLRCVLSAYFLFFFF